MENESKCVLCSDDGADGNEIIKCTKCTLSAHVLCYGILEADNFICSPCAKSVHVNDIECALCLKKGGAMKTTTNGKWAHVMCALCSKDAQFILVVQKVCISHVDSLKAQLKRSNKRTAHSNIIGIVMNFITVIQKSGYHRTTLKIY